MTQMCYSMMLNIYNSQVPILNKDGKKNTELYPMLKDIRWKPILLDVYDKSCDPVLHEFLHNDFKQKLLREIFGQQNYVSKQGYEAKFHSRLKSYLLPDELRYMLFNDLISDATY